MWPNHMQSLFLSLLLRLPHVAPPTALSRASHQQCIPTTILPHFDLIFPLPSLSLSLSLSGPRLTNQLQPPFHCMRQLDGLKWHRNSSSQLGSGPYSLDIFQLVLTTKLGANQLTSTYSSKWYPSFPMKVRRSLACIFVQKQKFYKWIRAKQSLILM